MPAARILTTAFEPNDNGLNASQVVVESLVSNPPALLESLGNRLRYAILPGNTHTLTDVLVTLIDEHQPDFCVLVGQAPGRSKITFERVATNLRDFMVPDRAGNLETGSHIFADAPAGYLALSTPWSSRKSCMAPAFRPPPLITPAIIFAIKRCMSLSITRQRRTNGCKLSSCTFRCCHRKSASVGSTIRRCPSQCYATPYCARYATSSTCRSYKQRYNPVRGTVGSAADPNDPAKCPLWEPRAAQAKGRWEELWLLADSRRDLE